ncbi:hypothetical protein DBZ36_10790 [Alginatibacterium sediminis]|uniref:Uncharacterized protein n=1 Tax=Alginatibacterium sediminis TaxID=2164068 RepID=A0A420EDX2_9ALTE|nr:hypothetical protein [Alginatibacterium sediminis]RKF18866.1 hypothetical protein DBZ36_10790 [Alginatibacterium sediminis]
MSANQSKHQNCSNRGGRRDGCGRKPGVKTQPIRLPQWLIEQLSEQGDARELIVQACVSHYQLCTDPSGDAHD